MRQMLLATWVQLYFVVIIDFQVLYVCKVKIVLDYEGSSLNQNIAQKINHSFCRDSRKV